MLIKVRANQVSCNLHHPTGFANGSGCVGKEMIRIPADPANGVGVLRQLPNVDSPRPKISPPALRNFSNANAASTR